MNKMNMETDGLIIKYLIIYIKIKQNKRKQKKTKENKRKQFILINRNHFLSLF